MASDGEMAESGMVRSHNGGTDCRNLHLLVVWVLGLLKEEVGGQLLVLVAREVSLDDKVALEAQATQTLNSFALVLGDGHGLRTRRQRGVLVSVLGKQLQELLRVLCDHLRQLWVSRADLLQDGLKHLRLLLYDLS